MGHTFTVMRAHAIFSTAGRRALIYPELQPRLWDYLGGIGRTHEIPVHAVGGVENHAHILLSVPPTLTLAKTMQTLKAYSSKWINEEGLLKSGRFAWQEGYAAFSVSESNVGAVTAYIKNQAEHHRRHSFEDELRSLLVRHGIEFDPRYLFG